MRWLVVVAIEARVLRDENSAQVVRFVPERMKTCLGRRVKKSREKGIDLPTTKHDHGLRYPRAQR
jgi:hypothetical protein